MVQTRMMPLGVILPPGDTEPRLGTSWLLSGPPWMLPALRGAGGGGVLLHTLQCQAFGFKGLTVAPMGRMGSMGQGPEPGVSGVSAKILASDDRALG